MKFLTYFGRCRCLSQNGSPASTKSEGGDSTNLLTRRPVSLKKRKKAVPLVKVFKGVALQGALSSRAVDILLLFFLRFIKEDVLV